MSAISFFFFFLKPTKMIPWQLQLLPNIIMGIGYHGDEMTSLGYFKFHQSFFYTHFEWVTVAWTRFIVLRGARCLQRSTPAGKEELLECEEKRRERCCRASKKMQSTGMLFFWGCHCFADKMTSYYSWMVYLTVVMFRKTWTVEVIDKRYWDDLQEELHRVSASASNRHVRKVSSLFLSMEKISVLVLSSAYDEALKLFEDSSLLSSIKYVCLCILRNCHFCYFILRSLHRGVTSMLEYTAKEHKPMHASLAVLTHQLDKLF